MSGSGSDTGCACQACVSGAGTCGCCDGIETITPRTIANRPGLSRLAARIGTHADFLESMQARLSTHALAEGGRPLSALRTRDRSDPSIALLDAFAAAGDVLTFYQERIANEGYLRTATRDRSVRELARLIGYEPGPGVAANTYLAFSLDSAPDTPVTIAAGTGAQSVPGQNELPQIFETMRDLDARARWNTLGVRVTEPERGIGDVIYLAGADTGLKPGDVLLFQHGKAKPVPKRVIAVEADIVAKRTLVTVDAWSSGGKKVAVKDEQIVATDGIDMAMLAELREKAPGGTIAPKVVEGIVRFEDAAPEQRTAMLDELHKLIAEARARLKNLKQEELRAWLDEIDLVLAGPINTMLPHNSLPIESGYETVETAQVAPRPAWIEALAVPASIPPRSAEQLLRSTKASFATGSEASYRALAVAAPAVGTRIAAALSGGAVDPQDFKVYVFRVRAGVFGRTFPRRMRQTRGAGGDGSTESVEIGEWPIVTVRATDGVSYRREQPNIVMLDSVQDGILPGSWALLDMRAVSAANGEDWVVDRADAMVLAEVEDVAPKLARADYGGSGDTTALRLADETPWIKFHGDIANRAGNQAIIDRDFELVRRTVVYARPELLPLADRPIPDELCVKPKQGKALPWVELDGLYAGLEPGRYVAVTGERADIGGVEGIRASEIAMISEVIHGVRSADGSPLPQGDKDAQTADRVHSFLCFANPLAYCYRRDTVRILGNVAKATHGQTHRETLGNVPPGAARPVYPLKRAPLTFVPAPNAAGVASTLEVFVDDIRWRAVRDLISTGPTERVYTVRNDPGGKATVIFPDGRDGARPPAGMQNVRAVYRVGIGRPGNMGAGRLEQLVERPLGLRGVTNPVPATDGAEAERREQTRRNAPISTLALDRLVSIRDHADFACCFAGIARASAQVMASGTRRIVHLTIAAEDDAPINPAGELIANLRGAFRALGDPALPVVVASRELKLLIAAARIRIDPDRLWEPVAQAVRTRLIDRFGFGARELAEGLAPSVLIAAIQSVPGVAWVDLDTFGGVATMRGPASARLPLSPDEIGAAVAEVAKAGIARWVPAWPARADIRSRDAGLFPAELLLLSPDVPATLVLNQIK